MAKKLVEDITARVDDLREKVLCQPQICLERGYWMTESYKETESEPPAIRRAKALQKILQNMTLNIRDGELIVGTPTCKQRGAPLVPEVQWEWYLDEMELLSSREWDRFMPLSAGESARMREFLPYWKGKSLYEKCLTMIPEDKRRLEHKIQAGAGHIGNSLHQAHMAVDYERVINKGLNDVKKQVSEESGKLNLADMYDFEKYQFLKAVSIALEAATAFANRYAELASSLAGKEKNAQRKAELEKIAEMCRQVPANPARNFYEALQSVWFIQIVLTMEAPGAGISLGRPDQYLYPLYKKDLEEGRLTSAEARELIALLYIKLNSLVIAYPSEIAKSYGGFPTIINIILGGLTRDGKDAVNELSYIFLDAEDDVRLTAEDLVIRVHKNTPDAFLMKACQVAKSLRGKLKFVSDEMTIQQLLSDGKPIEYARDYIVTGCSSPSVPGRSQDISGPIFNLPLMLELALNNGACRLTGEQIGPKTGDPRKFKSYDEVWDAYRKQVEALVPVSILFRNACDQLYAAFTPNPFQSSLFHGCIEKGKDITNGGTAPYVSHAILFAGSPNVGDSLAAIKKAVFEDKKITMDRLIDALDRNFEGEDEILYALKAAPKFGNDDDYVDSILNEVLIHAGKVVGRHRGIAGAISNIGAVTVTANVPMGQMVGALPDGRRASEPLSEGGISPYQGRNVNGPTATMRSVAKLDHVKFTNGSVLNMRFNPEVLKDDGKMRKFASLIRTFCETGGALVQFNIVDIDTLKDAQKHPDKYRDLLVRVATYSAYFTELGPELQNDIMRRMEFQEV